VCPFSPMSCSALSPPPLPLDFIISTDNEGLLSGFNIAERCPRTTPRKKKKSRAFSSTFLSSRCAGVISYFIAPVVMGEQAPPLFLG